MRSVISLVLALCLLTKADEYYNVTQIFVIEVKAPLQLSQNLVDQLGPTVTARILPEFESVFGSYEVISSNTTRRRLFSTCPSSCSSKSTSTTCIALSCVTKSRGTKRRNRLLQANNGSCLAFNPNQARQAMNGSLGSLEQLCNIPMNVNIETLEDYLASETGYG